MVAAIFLPLGFLTVLLSINVGGIPRTENLNAFWLVIVALVIVVVVVVVVQTIIFRWKNWFNIHYLRSQRKLEMAQLH